MYMQYIIIIYYWDVEFSLGDGTPPDFGGFWIPPS